MKASIIVSVLLILYASVTHAYRIDSDDGGWFSGVCDNGGGFSGDLLSGGGYSVIGPAGSHYSQSRSEAIRKACGE